MDPVNLSLIYLKSCLPMAHLPNLPETTSIMRTTLQLAIFLSATLAWALEQRIPGYEPTLVARGLPTMSPNCTRHSTCDSCFGDGYVVCDNAGCFNPDAAQQCCKNGSRLSCSPLPVPTDGFHLDLCVAKDNGCCDAWVSSLHTHRHTNLSNLTRADPA